MIRTFIDILRQSLVNAVQDGCISIAKGAAYSMILTFFPTLLVLTDLLAGSRTTSALMLEITHALWRVLPPTTRQAALQSYSGDPHSSTRVVVSATIIAILASTGVMGSLIQGCRLAYRMRNTWGFWKEEGVALALIFLAGTPMLAATALIVFGAQLQSWLTNELGYTLLLTLAWSAIRWVSAVATCTLVLAIIYYVAPNREHGFHWVLPGALLATIAWLGTSALFGWYVQNIAEYSGIYGNLGAGIALLIWMYLLACIVLIGAQFNAEYERRRKRSVS
jgi:membrane protein